MNRFIRLLSFALLLHTIVGLTSTRAQIIVTVGTGTNTNLTNWYPNFPYQTYYDDKKIQYLYLASEIIAAGGFAGDISAVGLDVASTATQAGWPNVLLNVPNFRISMKQTTATTLTGIDPTGFTPVFGPATVSLTQGWNMHNFSSNFTWNGTSNIIVEFCQNGPAGFGSTGPLINCTNTTFQSNANWYHWTGGPFASPICPTTAPNSGNYNLGTTNQRPNMRFALSSGIVQSFPEDIDPRRVLPPALYDGSTSATPKPSLTFRRPAGVNIQLQYRIVGPLPSNNVVYRGLASASATDTIINITTGSGLITRLMDFSTGPAGGGSGIGNGDFDTRLISSGSYRLEAVLSMPSINFTQAWNKEFLVPLDHDVLSRNIISPTPQPFKYLRGINVPIAVRYQNLGLFNATQFRCSVEVRNSAGAIVHNDFVDYNNTPGLSTGQFFTANFAPFNTLQVGTYTFRTFVQLLNANDLNLNNNELPSSGTHTFEVQYDTELASDAVLSPSGNNVVGRPTRITARFRNNGAADMSDVPTTATLSRWDGTNWVQVAALSKVLPDISASGNNTSILSYDLWTPTQTGLYRICINISANNDPIPDNNTVCQEFTVDDGLNGTYTIGNTVSGPRNFSTIQSAVDALYSRGVTGPVVFELTDANYIVGNLNNTEFPALDLSSRIIGVNSTNTVTFRPSLLRGLTRSSIAIRLQTGNGVGIQFGQNFQPSNGNAVLVTQRIASNANSAGFITFNGGPQKSFRLMLDVGTVTPANLPRRAVIFMREGSRNITIKNCLIENFPQSTASYAANLPIVTYVQPTFTFEPEVRSTSSGFESYSAGVALRSIAPTFQGNNAFALDTIPSINNVIDSNDISGFGYGVVDIGMGVLFFNDIAQPISNPRHQRYYNANNRITNNVISSVRRAGVYLGYTENNVVANNRIYNVGIGATGAGGSAAGIMVGGAHIGSNPSQLRLVYNNINTLVARNEISNITSDEAVTGILVEQSRRSYDNPSGGSVTFPNVNERTQVVGNMIWGLDRTTQTATCAGIHLLTTRSLAQTGLNRLLTPVVNNYHTRGDSIVNNTVFLQSQITTNGASVVGIGIQNVLNAVHINNAIALTGAASAVNTAAGNVFAGLFYQGLSPRTTGGLTSNFNAYFVPNGAITRYVEIDAISQLLEVGGQSDYQFLSQWKSWTGQDINSVVGNFPADHILTNTSPQRLRINTNPAPLGSILDRRGARTGAGLVDLDGDGRGVNGARFSIGADEFVGRLYVNDIEALEITGPAAYRSGSGIFSDAEYIMTNPGVNITAVARNNGSASQSGVIITATMLMQDASGNFTVPVNTLQQTATIPAGESVNLTFNFNLNPRTYSETGYAVPTQFATMARNVTPLYRVILSTVTDENNPNNTTQKDYRFYVSRSPISMMTSSTATNADPVSTLTSVNDRIGKLNHDEMVRGLQSVGFSSTAFDLFDRSGWEPRGVNYGIYRSLFWSEDTARLTRQMRQDVRAFLATTGGGKKNFVVASQEIVNKHIGLDAINDEAFVRYTLRAVRSPQGTTPLVAGYNNFDVIGQALARGVRERVLRTTNALDSTTMPMPTLMRIYSDNQVVGLAQSAYSYANRNVGITDSIMGVATSALGYNVVFLGVDWRHLPRVGVNNGSERVVRSIIEYIERNDGTVVPVELSSFTAERFGKGDRVNVSWETASEKNASYFDVERSEVSERGGLVFTSVGTHPAEGNSNIVREYSITDGNVSPSRAYVYRLKMVDLDGTTEYSNEVLVAALEESGSVEVSPNPVVSEAIATVVSPSTGEATVSVVDISGRDVQQVYSGMMNQGETKTLQIDTRAIASGTYTLVVRQSGVVVGVKRINIVK